MAYVKTITVSSSSGGDTTSPPIRFDIKQSPFAVGIGCVTTGTSSTYTIQHTFDDPYTTNLSINGSATWFNHSVLTSITSSRDSNYAFPVKGARVVQAAAASVASTIVTFIQAQGS